MAGQLWGTNSVGGFMYSDELSDYLRLQNFPLTKWRPLADAKDFSDKGYHSGDTVTGTSMRTWRRRARP
jgi:hypothetical protein